MKSIELLLVQQIDYPQEYQKIPTNNSDSIQSLHNTLLESVRHGDP